MSSDFVGKKARQDMILEIIREREVRNQNELIRALSEQGVCATQSSISRDIHELAIAKVEGRYMVGVLPVSREGDTVNEHVDACVRPEVASLSPAGQNLLVVKTNPGGAVALARSVEEVRWPEVVGAIAGQDSVFIATLGKREQLHLIARLEEFMPNRVASPVREEVSVHKRHPQPVSVL